MIPSQNLPAIEENELGILGRKRAFVPHLVEGEDQVPSTNP